MEANIVFLPGDGIGPEVVDAAGKVLGAIADRFGHTFHTRECLIGGGAIDYIGVALPEGTLSACQDADAILLGAVGGPQWDDPSATVRPEQGLLGLRKELGLYANLRPVRPHPAMMGASPLRREYLEGVDILVMRELTGGIYFGEPRLRRIVDDEIQAVDTMVYSESEIRRVAELAFRLARRRRGKVTSVDKANVLETSRLWRQTTAEVGLEYPDVILEHMLVDAAAMHLINRASSFDVVLTGNLFGDILSDEISVLTGSMGNLPSASIGGALNSVGMPKGLYEPIHGSAPDIAGKGIANPIGMILSVALLLQNSLGLQAEAESIQDAVWSALDAGYRTVDIAQDHEAKSSTSEMGDIIARHLAIR